MITVTVFNKNQKIVGVQVEGHAEYDRKGKDIVCSAVSILYINLVNSLENFTDDEKELNGSTAINFQNVILKSMPSREAELLFQSFLLGITTIKDKYGKRYITILNQEV
ncbi:MAG: ribosomal-processing cysteine protease Prp [Bacteroidales bacterium]|nr:ribosomal-processing cysteine protease Prp [Clostridium sp.]MCM1204697.1 ribosomal-processing cysteine protease Prp [Bacteroidales bacterium]